MEENVIIEALSQVSAGSLIVWVCTIIGIICGIAVFAIKVYKLLEKYRKERNKVEEKDRRIDSLEESVTQIKVWTKAQNIALKVILANELDRKYRYYLQLGFIPDKEFDEYVDMHDAYKGLGGNHHGDEKFNYIIDRLERQVME